MNYHAEPFPLDTITFFDDLPFIVEVGASIGDTTSEFIRKWPRAKIFCFEPDPAAYALLNKAFGLNERVTLFRTALGNKTGVLPWYRSTSGHADGKRAASSSLNMPLEHLEAFPQVEFIRETVLCTSLDSVKLPRKYVDLLWVDVNGAELEFLLGATEALQGTYNVVIEVSNKELYKGQVTAESIVTFMKVAGFKLMGIWDWLGNYGNAYFKRR
jgi:FkbM family methyltransferase